MISKKQRAAMDKACEALPDNAYSFPSNFGFGVLKQQPHRSSWVHAETNVTGLATDMSSAIKYDDSDSFRKAFVGWVEHMLTDELIELFMAGGFRNIAFSIGPDSFSGVDLNEDCDIEVKYG